jgi:hypothetical protein
MYGGERSASRPSRFTPGGRAPDNHFIGGGVDLRDGLNAVAKRKYPYRESNPGHPAYAS